MTLACDDGSEPESVAVLEQQSEKVLAINALLIRNLLIAVLLLGYLTLPLWMVWVDSKQWYSREALWGELGTTFYVPVTLAIIFVSGLVGLLGRKEYGAKAFCMLNAVAIMGAILGLSFLRW